MAFEGMEARGVEVQAQVAPGASSFVIVGLPDKAVRESRDRIVAALAAMGLSLPPRRLTVNLAPADLEKAGAHYDLPIACAVLAALGVVDAETAAGFVLVGELSLDGRVGATPGVLVAALHAAATGRGLACPAAQGTEAAWLAQAGHGLEIVPVASLAALVGHLRGERLLPPPPPPPPARPRSGVPDLAEVRGQDLARRAVEIAAAGGHHLLMVGPPGAGKSLIAAAIPGILPPLAPAEALEVAMIASVAGELKDGRVDRTRPFRSPHHSASMAALTGGGPRARPGEVSLAHRGVLFLDELAEFPRAALDALRQPLERGAVEVARAAAHVTWPAQVQLVAAMNPCRCGHLADPARACSRAPRCAADYQARVSGPLLDRIDLHVEVEPVPAAELARPRPGEPSAVVAERVAHARGRAARRWAAAGADAIANGAAGLDLIDRAGAVAPDAHALLERAAEAMRLSARGWTRALRVARTIADLDGSDGLERPHMAEALSFRQRPAAA